MNTRRDGEKKAKLLEAYQNALRELPPPGTRHAWILRCANFAAFADVPAEQAVREITAALPRPPNPPREVAETVEKAYRDHGARIASGLGAYVPPKPRPRFAPRMLREYMRRGEERGATEADYWEASPVRMLWGDDWRLDAVAQLKALFHPGEIVFCGDRFGQTVKTAAEWVAQFESGGEIPPLLCANPMKADGGKTAGGKVSFRCDDAVSVFRHAVAEFDSKLAADADGNPIMRPDGKPETCEFPLAEQLAAWRGWGLQYASSVTFSGSKSYHVLLRVDAAGAAEWRRNVRDGLFRRHLIPLGCDGACQNPARLSRLAGAVRADKGGAVQKLLYVARPLAGWLELEEKTRAAETARKDGLA